MYVPSNEVDDDFIEHRLVFKKRRWVRELYTWTIYFRGFYFPSYLLANKPTNYQNTTHESESLNAHNNSHFHSSHPNIYQLLKVLLKFQIESNMKSNSLSKNIYSIWRTIDKRKFLINSWNEYVRWHYIFRTY